MLPHRISFRYTITEGFLFCGHFAFPQKVQPELKHYHTLRPAFPFRCLYCRSQLETAVVSQPFLRFRFAAVLSDALPASFGASWHYSCNGGWWMCRGGWWKCRERVVGYPAHGFLHGKKGFRGYHSTLINLCDDGQQSSHKIHYDKQEMLFAECQACSSSDLSLGAWGDGVCVRGPEFQLILD